MKIVNRAEFLTLPPNTLFSKYSPCYLEQLEIKMDSLFFGEGKGDFWSIQIGSPWPKNANDTGEFMEIFDKAEAGTPLSPDLEQESRDGLHEEDQLFAVWEKEDVAELIERLKLCL